MLLTLSPVGWKASPHYLVVTLAGELPADVVTLVEVDDPLSCIRGDLVASGTGVTLEARFLWRRAKSLGDSQRITKTVAYTLVPAAKRRKFDDRTMKMRFLGYHKGHRGTSDGTRWNSCLLPNRCHV